MKESISIQCSRKIINHGDTENTEEEEEVGEKNE
jgi:hypothetical protein